MTFTPLAAFAFGLGLGFGIMFGVLAMMWGADAVRSIQKRRSGKSA